MIGQAGEVIVAMLEDRSCTLPKQGKTKRSQVLPASLTSNQRSLSIMGQRRPCATAWQEDIHHAR